jgi:hypothetical protein
MNESLALTPYNASAELAIAKPTGQNYNITIGGLTTKIKRDVDFGVIPKPRSPRCLRVAQKKSVWPMVCSSSTRLKPR